MAEHAGEPAGNPNADHPKVIVIFGATGKQGGSVLKAMKDDSRFLLKAVTRNPDSNTAKQLASEGIQVIKADLDDAVSCKAAVKDAYGVFLVTNYWEFLNADREIQQGKNVVDAVKANGVQHLVFSGLQSAKEGIGKDGCNHFDAKHTIYKYIVEQGVPYTVIDYPFYFENFLSGSKPRKNENGEFVLAFPMGSVPLDAICIAESGEIVHQIFALGDEHKGQWLAVASDSLTIEEYAATLTKIFHTKKFVAGTVTPEQFAQLGFPGATDLAVMFEFYQSGKCLHDVQLARKLFPGLSTFEQFVEKNRDAFEAAYQ